MIIRIKTAATQGLVYSLINKYFQEPIDLSVATVKLMVKKNPLDQDVKALILKELVHPESNLLYFELSAEDTRKIKPGDYTISLKIFYDEGPEVIVREDTLSVHKGVFDV